MIMPSEPREAPATPLFSPHVRAKAMEALNVVVMVHGADRRPFQLEQLTQLQEALTHVVDCLFPADGDTADFSGSDSLDGMDYTHPVRVAELAATIGREMGKPRSALIDLAMAAALMNIGNLALRRTVIDEPRRLLESEWEEHVHAHPAQGVALLADSGLSDAVVRTVAQHHERLDGSGYPAGLRGDAIGGPSRILAVADTFISLRSLRPHRPALPTDEALREIAAGSGSLFDPAVVAAFEAVIARYTGIARDREAEAQPRAGGARMLDGVAAVARGGPAPGDELPEDAPAAHDGDDRSVADDDQSPPSPGRPSAPPSATADSASAATSAGRTSGAPAPSLGTPAGTPGPAPAAERAAPPVTARPRARGHGPRRLEGQRPRRRRRAGDGRRRARQASRRRADGLFAPALYVQSALRGGWAAPWVAQ